MAAVSLPLSASPAITSTHSLKRSEPSATPVTMPGTDDEVDALTSAGGTGEKEKEEEPPKKKRRVALTRVGDVGS